MMLYEQKFHRNPLSRSGQQKLRKAAFALVGLGGTGGFILENLLRMGAENLIVFDRDRFDLSNFNRQLLAVDRSLDQSKASAARERARSINNGAGIKAYSAFNEAKAAGADILIDGSDNLPAKLEMARAARKLGIPFVFCSASSTRGMVTTFGRYRFEKAFQLQEGAHAFSAYKTCSSILCPAAAMAGTLAASQAANIVLGKPYARAPEALFFDLFRKDVFWRAKLG